MGGVVPIDELANIYPAGRIVIVTEIFAQPRGECQHANATLRLEV
jgi:hypothetical protein